eukprot:tig00020675_g12683.t1
MARPDRPGVHAEHAPIKQKPPFSYANCTVRLQLHPSKIGNPLEGLKELLCQYLMRYVDLLGGVVMAFENVRILPDSERILYDNPYIQYNVSVDFLLFKPSPHVPLECRVVHQSAAGINANLLGVFPVKIGADHMAGKLRWNQRRNMWVSRDGSNSVTNGSTVVRLRAIDWKEVNNITHFDGRIDEPGLGPIWGGGGDGGEAPPRPKPKPQRRTGAEEAEAAAEPAEPEEEPAAPPAKKGKSKGAKAPAAAEAEAAEAEAMEEEPQLKKKKRRRAAEGAEAEAEAEAEEQQAASAPPPKGRARAPAPADDGADEASKKKKKKRETAPAESDPDPAPAPAPEPTPAKKKRKTAAS